MSRGLLLSDHSSKILTGLIKSKTEAPYTEYVGHDQHGCVPRRGTEFAHHCTRAFLELTMQRQMSIFV
eukprot:10056251-Karenia_brevis.AAC.1